MNYRNLMLLTLNLIQLIILIIFIVIRYQRQKKNMLNIFPDRIFNICLYGVVFIFAERLMEAIFNLNMPTNEFSMYSALSHLLFFIFYNLINDNMEAFNETYLQIGLNIYNIKNLKIIKTKKTLFNRFDVTFLYNDGINAEKKVGARMSAITYKNLEIILS